MAASKRALAALAAGALIAPLSPFASPAFAQTAPTVNIRSIEIACPSNQLPENRFSDVDDDSTFEDEITCIAEYEVTSGQTATTYNPTGFVTRQQMAGFIANVLREAGLELDTRDAGFTDLDRVGNQGLVDSINALANAGVVVGTTPTATERKPFSPGQNVRRDQMASFIAQAQEALDRGVTTDEDFFTDDEGNVHEDNINVIASEGITGGRGGAGLYDTASNVTREQMAAFLARKIDLLVEEGLIEARFGAPSEVNITETAVNAGQPITGTITEAENVDTVTASGSCIAGGAVTDSNTATADTFEFSIPTTATATPGNCTVTFTVTFDNGRQQTLTDTVTINAAPQGTNTRPELVSAQIAGTVVQGQQTPTNPLGTTVVYTFDEDVAPETAGAAATGFNAYNADRTLVTGGTIVSSSGRTVTVRFNDADTAAEAAAISVATVDFDAVRDLQGQANPEGDAPLGATSGGGTQPLPAGVTTAPDLVSVGNFRQGATAGVTVVDFTFDQAATVTRTTGFSLITVDGANGANDDNQLNGTGPAVGSTQASGGTVVGGNGTTVITVQFTNPDGPDEGNAAGDNTDPIVAAANIARGTVDAGTVSSGSTTTPANVLNALQAVDVSSGGNTREPDLVSVELRPGATSGAADQAVFTFDQNVDTATAGATAVQPGAFALYSRTGVESNGTAAVVSASTPTQVLVTFGATAADEAVGGNVDDGAVTAPAVTGTTPVPALRNEQDEVGVANTTNQEGRTAGRTDSADLTAVAIRSIPSPIFGAPNQTVATYTFDEDVTLAAQTNFFLYLADGTRLTASSCGTTTPATGQTAEDVDNTITCTAFGLATPAQIGSAVLGTVEAGAVNEETGGRTNIEGAERTTGGTGTPAV